MTAPEPSALAHEPEILRVLTEPDCVLQGCDHLDGQGCPTRGFAACTTCTAASVDRGPGDVAWAVKWPCAHARGGAA